MRFTGFIGPSYTLRSVNVDAQRSVNLYPELNEIGTGKDREIAALVGTPGLVKLATLGTGPVRRLYRASNNRTFAVSGAELYEITDPANPILLGALSRGTGPAGITDNGVDLVVVDGEAGWTYRFSTSTLSQITDPEFPNTANAAFFLDQYIIVNEPDTGRFWYSAISDATDWNGLDFSTAEGAPDNLQTIFVDHRELILVGDTSIEVYYNVGDADNPFQRIQGAYLEEGGIAGTIVKLDNTVFYVARNEQGQGIVKRAQGGQAQRISTHAIELAIAGYGDIASATSYTYQDKGHSFYALNFSGAATTWVFDVSTSLWHERTYTPADGQPQQRHRAECHVFDGTRHLVGDYANGNLYRLDDDVFTDDGAPITRDRVAPHVSLENKNISYPEFQLDLEAGVGLANGNAPVISLRWSNDGAHTWSGWRDTSMGKQGEYTRRAIWRRLGSARSRTFHVRSTAPVKQVWIGANFGPEVGTH